MNNTKGKKTRRGGRGGGVADVYTLAKPKLTKELGAEWGIGGGVGFRRARGGGEHFERGDLPDCGNWAHRNPSSSSLTPCYFSELVSEQCTA